MEKKRISDYQVVVAMPTSGKTTMEECISESILVLDTDVVWHWVCSSWANIRAFRKYRSEEWASQMDQGISSTVENICQMIIQLLQAAVPDQQVIIITNLHHNWADKRRIYVGVEPEELVRRYNNREQLRLKTQGRKPKEKMTKETARAWLSGFKQSAGKEELVVLGDDQYLAELFGYQPTADQFSEYANGKRAYRDLALIAQLLQKRCGLSLIIPSWLVPRSSSSQE